MSLPSPFLVRELPCIKHLATFKVFSSFLLTLSKKLVKNLTKMKMVTVSLQIPDEADKHYRSEAKRRMISKGAVMRDVLCREAVEARQRASAEDQERQLAAK